MADLLPDTLKTCNMCRQALPLSAYARCSSTKDGHTRRCKACAAAYLKQWSADNPDKVKERKARHYANKRENILAKQAEYRRANPEKVAAVVQRWHDARPEKRREASLAWARRNREYVHAATIRRRATQLSATPSWADDEFERLVMVEAHDGARKRSALTGVKHHVDHIVPIRGKTVCGLHCAANLRVIPAKVNQSKNNRHWPDMP